MPRHVDNLQFSGSRDLQAMQGEEARDIFWVRNAPELTFQYASATFSKIWDVPVEELEVSPDAWLAHVYTHDQPILVAALERWATCEIHQFRNLPYRKVWRGSEVKVMKSWVENMSNAERAIEYRIVRPDGVTRWIHDRILSVHSVDGRVVQMDGIAEDVTSLHKMESALIKSKAWNQQCLEYGGIGTWEREVGGSEGVWGGVIRDLLGLPGNSPVLPLDQIRAMIHPDDRAAVIATQNRLQASGGEFDLEYRHLLPDGSVRWINNRGKYAVDADGGPRMMGVLLDVTRRRESEENSQRSEAFFRTLAENVHEMLWLSDPLLHQVYYLSPNSETPLFRDICGVFRDPWDWQVGLHAEDQDAAAEFLLRQARGRAAQMEVRAADPAGAARWFWFQSFPFSGPDGTRLVAGVVRDVTERRQHAGKLVEDAETRRDALVAEVHHRIKNNLQGVIGLLRQHSTNVPAVARAIDLAAAQVQSVALVHGLMARDVNGGVCVAQLLLAVAGSIESILDAPLDLEGSEGIGKRLQVAEGEAVALALIFNELLTNAIEHRARHEQGTPIQVRVEAANHGVRIRIRNRGQLSPAVDFAAGKGLGNGLGLVRALLPGKGAALSLLTTDGNVVEAILKLTVPVIRFTSGQAIASSVAASRQGQA